MYSWTHKQKKRLPQIKSQQTCEKTSNLNIKLKLMQNECNSTFKTSQIKVLICKNMQFINKMIAKQKKNNKKIFAWDLIALRSNPKDSQLGELLFTHYPVPTDYTLLFHRHPYHFVYNENDAHFKIKHIK